MLLERAQLEPLLRHISAEEIPPSSDLFTSEELEAYLAAQHDLPASFIGVGDTMIDGRAKRSIAAHGSMYPFEAVLPLLRRAPIVVANLEGTIAREAPKGDRRYTYRMKPKAAKSLLHAGINTVCLANNHIMDCGPDGLLETLGVLAETGIAGMGAGANSTEAHRPLIRIVNGLRIALFSYYWHERTEAGPDTPGSAMSREEDVLADLPPIRPYVDRIVLFFHRGNPYEREPTERTREKARFAIDCGADMIVAHHPHVLQPFEIYRGRPIFYSIGNFVFGSGNTRAEGLLVSTRFEATKSVIHAYPLYVKNRDPRVAYQPKVLRGGSARRVLEGLKGISGESGAALELEEARLAVELPWTELTRTS